MSTLPPPGYPPSSGYGYGYGPAPGPKPATNLVWGILTTVLCCLPFGIVSIVYAARVDGLWNSGDAQGAYDASKRARTWAIVSALTAVGLLILYAVGAFALFSTSGSSGGGPLPTY